MADEMPKCLGDPQFHQSKGPMADAVIVVSKERRSGRAFESEEEPVWWLIPQQLLPHDSVQLGSADRQRAECCPPRCRQLAVERPHFLEEAA
jgi:hypothetical protein